MSQQTDHEVLQYMLDNKHATHANVKWGSGYRNIVIFQGKKYQYNGKGGVNKILLKSILPLYITMSSKVKITIKTDDSEKNKVVIKNKIKEKRTILDN
jgi:hypothetical protein